MNEKQFERMRNEKGFIAALDQSGGSTPKALKNYGIDESAYKNDEEMFNLVHEMRSRLMTSPYFTGEKVLAAILFEQTMDRKVEGKLAGDYLYEEKNIIPFVKVDKGLDELKDGVQLMKPISNLDETLERAVERKMFGTKMRSLIKEANIEGIKKIVNQQFEIGLKILEKGLIPILEPEVDINSPTKQEAESILKEEVLKHLDALADDTKVMFKFSIPTVDNFYKEIINHKNTLRVVALSGGYERDEANRRLAKNNGLIASYSRALLEGLTADLPQEEFDEILKNTINATYEASIK